MELQVNTRPFAPTHLESSDWGDPAKGTGGRAAPESKSVGLTQRPYVCIVVVAQALLPVRYGWQASVMARALLPVPPEEWPRGLEAK